MAGQPPGTIMYLVEFADGDSIEVPERYLLRHGDEE